MSTVTNRWTRNAVIARLAASEAIDHDTVSTLRERAERRIELLRVMSAVEEGRIDPDAATARFDEIRAITALPLSA
ncbi:hypothetical protein AX769_10395 [Frondihabitans sp. PAMC 28766]|uniref:hypothetical protein n=1 Tax=Frondihabitans sp. PAMC 28766 TaxID=1795630 RepID=UPI00078D9D73|nr:hypothetical protein [Frondihabitans sp. PAMC 28766]AMM20482.1 hypothetical protein AX769_10395 [Frondihabitans sp. PAMC 28766]